MADTRAKGQRSKVGHLATTTVLLFIKDLLGVRGRDGGTCQNKLCLCSLKQSEILISQLNRYTEVGISCPYKVIIGPTLKD